AETNFRGVEILRKLVKTYEALTGLARPVERPRSGVQQKNKPEEKAKKSQRLLITWVTDEPSLYEKIKKYITAEDFTEDLYRRVAERLFRELEQGDYNPAGIISMFEDEEEQRAAAELFHTNLPELTTLQEREKAFHDIVLAVKKNSYEYYTAKLGTDVNALNQVIEGKKALEELARTHISLD
ncbi:MAG: DNA primase, partial [Acetatifactor sp.]|nr:DNA primase [Acetatifactor sp.]